jgi:hypothetical protein
MQWRYMMPVRISATTSRSLDLLRNAATVTSCKYPALPASFCYRKARQNMCSEKPAPGIRIPRRRRRRRIVLVRSNLKMAWRVATGVQHPPHCPQPPGLRFAIGVCSGARTSIRVSRRLRVGYIGNHWHTNESEVVTASGSRSSSPSSSAAALAARVQS